MKRYVLTTETPRLLDYPIFKPERFQGCEQLFNLAHKLGVCGHVFFLAYLR
jgi:hypothetical protein